MLHLSRETRAFSSPFVKIFAIAGLVVLATCSGQPDAESIIDRAIAIHGGDSFDNADITFQFRDKKYRAKRKKGMFQYERIFEDSLGTVRDVLSNDGFIRYRNNEPVHLDDEIEGKYAASVNSVIYFALLPFGLNDPAVQKRYIGESMVNGNPYYEVKVTFEEEGGGDDHEDTYIYWIHQQDYSMDYLAYSFLVEGGGTRFREAINPRVINGIRFVDYVNYTYEGDSVDLDTYEMLFEEGKLKEVSRIELENVKVKKI